MAPASGSVDPKRLLALTLGGLVALGAALLLLTGPKELLTAARDLWNMSPIRYRHLDRRLLSEALAESPLRSAGDPAGNPPGELVIIVLDTVRRDHLGLYGYPLPTSPGLDAWADEARVYTQARSTSAWTVPSHGSLFTGLLPSEHGAHGLAPEAKTWQGLEDALALPGGTRTLASHLVEHGYATVGIAANRAYLNRGYGLDQGFEVWLCEQLEDPPDGICPRARRITDLALATLAEPRSEPLFLFLNYMDAHIPYRGHLADDPGLPAPARPFSGREHWWRERMQDVLEGRSTINEEEHALLTAAYDQEIRYLDGELQRLLARLPALGIDEHDLVVITADHGEYLGEHQLLEHSYDLYEPVLRIPLVIRGAGHPPGRDDSPVRLSDLAGLILPSLGLSPLVDRDPAGALGVAELYYIRHADLGTDAMTARFHRIRRSFQRGDHKVITTDGRCVEAYDLARDPQELTPLMEAEWTGDLCAEGEAWRSSITPGQGEPPGSQAGSYAMLRALGYL